MMEMIKYFWNNYIKLQWWLWWFLKHYLVYPWILILSFFLFKKYGGANSIFDPEWWRNLINTFAIVSWFLLTGLSVILSNTKLRKDQISQIEDKYKLYVMEYGDWDIYVRISKFKLSILLATISLIGICIILAIIVTIFQCEWFIVYLIIYFLWLLFIWLLTLIKQILTYLSIVEFDWK